MIIRSIIAALALAAVTAGAVGVVKHTSHERGPTEIFQILDVRSWSEGYSITLYDPGQRSTLSGPVEVFGISPGELERVDRGSRVPCWHIWYKNLFTWFEMRKDTQCRIPPRKKQTRG